MNNEKAVIIESYKAVLKTESLKQNKLQVITAAGIFFGDINADEQNIGHVCFESLDNAINEFCKKSEIKNLTKTYITLYNVELLQNGGKINMSAVNIFIDDIIGISIGNK
jgi:hypothetical protein